MQNSENSGNSWEKLPKILGIFVLKGGGPNSWQLLDKRWFDLIDKRWFAVDLNAGSLTKV